VETSFQFEPAVLENLSRHLLGVIDDLLSVLIKDLSADFIKASYVPMNGAENSLIAFQADPVMFDHQLRAALRAKGFNIPDIGNIVIHTPSSSEGRLSPSV
jgi:hypothetical protein